ncbi:MAG: hypothetical protein ACP5XB_22545 [Isosphaeraceae bacterium]
MRAKQLFILPAVVFLMAACQATPALAQSNYQMSLTWPIQGALVTTGSMVSVSGSITVSNGAPAPVGVQATVDGYVGTGGVWQVPGAANTYYFNVAVYVPPDAPTGLAQDVFAKGSATGNGRDWGTAGAAHTTVNVEKPGH